MGAAKKITLKATNCFDYLIPQHSEFVHEYVKDFNGTQAAIRARYSKKTAAQQASRLLKNVKIQEAIAYLIKRNSTVDAINAEDERNQILKDTRDMYYAAVAQGNLMAASSLLQLRSRQHGMLSDKVINEDAKTLEINERERELLQELAHEQIRKRLKGI